MRSILTYLTCLFLWAVAGCKKKDPEKDADSTKGIGRTRLFVGTRTANDVGTNCDVFMPISLTALNKHQVLGNWVDTLTFQPSVSSVIYKFASSKEVDDYGKIHQYDAGLSWNPVNDTMNYNWHYSGAYSSGYLWDLYDLHSLNAYDRSLSGYVKDIIGTKKLSGQARKAMANTFPVDDTIYNVNDSITFTLVDDTTIRYSKDYIGIYSKDDFISIKDDLLHYKMHDATAKTITFQTYHDEPEFTTLTYNYGTNKVIFEQYLQPYPAFYKWTVKPE